MSVARPRSWWRILRETFRLWLERDAFTQAAALAFFALFSLAPVLVLFEVGAGLLFEKNAVHAQIVGQFELLMGHEQALAVDAMLGRAAFHMSGIIARVLGSITFVVGTLAVFVQLQDSLNKMWDVAPKPGPLIRHLLWKRVVSFALVLALGFVLVVSLILSTTIHALQNYAERYFEVPAGLFDTGNVVITYMLVTVLFAFIYRVLPDVEIPWKDVWLGAVVTSLLLTFGKWAIGFYLGRSDLAREYGAAGSMMVLLFWVYYAALLVLFGAIFTRVQSAHYHRSERPAEPGARRVVEKKVPVG